jgi:hypothetical protein
MRKKRDREGDFSVYVAENTADIGNLAGISGLISVRVRMGAPVSGQLSVVSGQ